MRQQNRRFPLILSTCVLAGLTACGESPKPNDGQGPIAGDAAVGGATNQNTKPATGGIANPNTSSSAIAGASTGGFGNVGGSTIERTTANPEGGNASPGWLNPTLAAEKSALDSELAHVQEFSSDDLIGRYPAPHAALGYDPADSIGLDLIQQSALALNDADLSTYKSSGLAISSRQQFPAFTYGYASIYAEHLPLFVSADSIMYPVHRSFDAILADIETTALIKELDALLTSMRAALPSTPIPETVRADDDLYLTVAQSLLKSQFITPTAGGDATKTKSFYDSATAAKGLQAVTLFGVTREEDFSQFAPRGHYVDQLRPELQGYFRAMMWLGRVDFRIIETQPDGTQLFQRPQLEAAIALRQLIDAVNLPHYSNIDATVSAFVGEHDNMVIEQVDLLLKDLGVANVDELAGVSDASIQAAIFAGGYGVQKIASQYIENDTSGTLPLSIAFALFGQRFTPDSYVFSQVVYDRVHSNRLMPNPLDVAFGALGNNWAAPLLKPELDKYAYAPNLAGVRVLIDSYPSDFWQESLYTLWVAALRALSPSSESTDPKKAGLPSIVATDAWGKRLLNAQLASWAELRHDTLLYTKQSYTSSLSCEFPDAYVEPYPQFFDGLAKFADRGQTLVSTLTIDVNQRVKTYFEQLRQIALLLGAMAENERTGTPHSAEQMTFINQTVSLTDGGGCAPTIVGASGWYPTLFYNGSPDSVKFDPTIADVHTQPTDEAGGEVGRILHVATGPAQLIVTSFDTCAGPRAYVGLVSSYYELITENWKRMTDPEWSTQVKNTPPAKPKWLEGI